MSEYYIGLMSGTSMDAIDAALVKFEEKAILEYYCEYPIDPGLRVELRQFNENTSIDAISAMDVRLAHLFAEAVNKLLNSAGKTNEDIVAIGSHGQTILHRPHGIYPSSIQIADPNVISSATGITTVADFRRMDMANGGQGAPLASAFHQYQFQKTDQSLIILNIGGMANITLLSDNKVIGFDTGPGNALLDDWTQQELNNEYDKDGAWAQQGNVNDALLTLMLEDEYFKLPPPKSTGREYFNSDWLEQYLHKVNNNISNVDVQATLLQLSAITIHNAIKQYGEASEVLACGGGVYNLLLMQTIQELLSDIDVVTTEKYGLAPDCIEAVTFAWLAKQRIENKTGNLPDVTGANRKVLLGGIYSPI